MLLVFNQKVLDYHLENAKYIKPLKLYRIFVTPSIFIDPQIRQFCALWGILLIDQELYSPPICEIIANDLYEKTASLLGRTVLEHEQLKRLQQLQYQANHLNHRLWRELDTVWNPQARLPGAGFRGGSQLPSTSVTKRWVEQHRELVQQTQLFKSQFEKWQYRNKQAEQRQELTYG